MTRWAKPLCFFLLVAGACFGTHPRPDDAQRNEIALRARQGLPVDGQGLEGSQINQINDALVWGRTLPSPFDSSLIVNYLIIDQDFGNDPGDVAALSTFHAMADRGEFSIIGVMGCTTDLNSPGCIDAINTYYGRPDIPVGRNDATALIPGPYPNIWNVDIASLWPNSFGTNGTLAVPATNLYRRLLAGKPDRSVTIVANGQLANLENLRNTVADSWSPLNGADLMKKKVRQIVISGGQYPFGNEYNFYTDPANASNFVSKSTCPLRFNGYEVGLAVVTGAGITNNLSVTHPLRLAFDKYNVIEADGDGRESWDQAGAVYGGRGLRRGATTYWTEVSGGFNFVSPAATNIWKTTSVSDHRYILASASAPTMVSLIDGLMLATPKLPATRSITQAMIATNLTTAAWKLSEADGGPWLDSVGSATMTNIAGSTITRVTGFTNGANQAARFNGTTSGMTTPHTLALNGGNSPYSIGVRVKFAVTNADQVLFCKAQGTAVDYFLYLPSGGLARPAFFVYDGAASSTAVGSVTYGGSSLQTNVAYQVDAWVEPYYSGNNARLGIRINNGTTYYATTTSTPGTNVLSRVAIGINCSSFAGQILNGDIDNVTFRKTIPGHTESTFIYNNGTFKEFPYND